MSGDDAEPRAAHQQGGQLTSQAWFYRIPAARGPVSGELRLEGDRLTFTATGRASDSMAEHLEELSDESGLAGRLLRGEPSKVLDARLEEVKIRFPVLAFGATMQVRRGDHLYRLAFYDPRTAWQGMFRTGIRTGRPWKAALAPSR